MISDLHSLYQQTEDRKNWADPTRDEMVKSLNKAHSVNKALITHIDQAQAEVTLTKLELKGMEKFVKVLLWFIGASWLVIGYIIKLLLPYAVKGMVR